MACFSPSKITPDERGRVIAYSVQTLHFTAFGRSMSVQPYLKAWKLHTSCAANIAVPHGRVSFPHDKRLTPHHSQTQVVFQVGSLPSSIFPGIAYVGRTFCQKQPTSSTALPSHIVRTKENSSHPKTFPTSGKFTYTTGMSHHIVIVGGGFAGALAARRLMEQHLPDTDVLLIDKQADFLFTPRLVDALASHDAHGNGWSAPLHELAARFGFRFLRGTVEHVNREQKTLTVYTEDLGTKTVPYDTLVLTPGAKACHYRIPGAAEHTYTLKSLDDVKRVHDRINELLRQAQQEEAVATKRRLLSFIVVGGDRVVRDLSLLTIRSW